VPHNVPDVSALISQAQEATKHSLSLSHWHLHLLCSPGFSCPSPREVLTDGAAAGPWAAARGNSLQISGIRIRTCRCLDGPSNLGSSWEVSREVSPSLCACTGGFPSTLTVVNGLVYESKSIKGTQQLRKLCCYLIIEKISSHGGCLWFYTCSVISLCKFRVKKSTLVLASARKRRFQGTGEINTSLCLQTMLCLDKY